MYQVLIADDERIECKGLEWLLHKYFPELKVLPSVYSGIQLMKAIEEQNPDIVITDINMPGMNGLEVLDIMKLKKKNFSAILLSAYSEFEYAQKAVYLGVSNYLVKPVRPEVFCEAVKKALQELDTQKQSFREAQKTEQMENEMQELMEAEILQSLMLGELDVAKTERFLETFSVVFRGGVVLTIRDTGGTEKEKYTSLVEYLKKAGICMAKRYRGDLILLFLPYDSIDSDNYREWTGDMLDTVLESLEFTEAACGISSWKEKIEDFPDAVKESSLALYGARGGSLCYFEKETITEDTCEFRKTEKQFLELLSSGKEEKAVDYLENWLDKQMEMGVRLEAARLFVAELFMRGRQNVILQDCRMQEEAEAYGTYWSRVSLCRDAKELKELLRKAIREWKRKDISEKRLYHKYVEASLLYMKNHYMEDLSLEQLAEKNGVSSFYLSRLFRQELSRSFVEILTDIRMENAVSLLRSSDCKIQDIGLRTGYQNAGHFFKVFKKHTGMTPGQMKKYLAEMSRE